ncbi:glycerate kinase [Thiomicrospira microaerophila]|uniref:glycerate kinase n=1 Tax=Thiomicrospira microaerophila TaxID=406020 RepID=UPI00201091E2|nr:glycerate kinase [Thiomicrospira microaerophila]UQB42399.1 glycerate kinase [Thiomicrospira microaerophila]
MKRILIAPDSFKGSLSAVEFCQIANHLIQHYWPEVEVIERPLSDGGEGFVDAFVYAGLAERKQVETLDPLGHSIQADFAWQAESHTAIIEMAQASGLPRLTPSERNPLHASSYGTGLVINAALQLGAQRVILGLGGSATNDGGAGALQALGVELLKSDGEPIQQGGAGLVDLAGIGCVPTNLKQIDWQLACDVTNPLLGELGATRVFGPQKGVTPKNHALLENGLAQFAKRIEQDLGRAMADRPGAGAAGGMAGGFIGVLNAQTQSGFDLLAQATQLEAVFQTPLDLVITGEGKLDAQTRMGKLPMRLAQLAQRYQVPTLGICGQLAVSPSDLPEFIGLFSLVQGIVDEKTAMQHTPQWLQNTLYSTLRLFWQPDNPL